MRHRLDSRDQQQIIARLQADKRALVSKLLWFEALLDTWRSLPDTAPQRLHVENARLRRRLTVFEDAQFNEAADGPFHPPRARSRHRSYLRVVPDLAAPSVAKARRR